MCGLSTTVSISFGCALVAGRKRVPSPAAGRTAFRTLRPALAEPSVCAELGMFEALLFIGSVFCTLQQEDGHHSLMWIRFSQCFCVRTVPGGLVGPCGVARCKVARVLGLVESRELKLAAKDHENSGD